jgi:hypothetical protein
MTKNSKFKLSWAATTVNSALEFIDLYIKNGTGCECG